MAKTITISGTADQIISKIDKAKKRLGSKENPVNSEPEFVVTQAAIKDGFLNYSYEILKGPNRGFVHNVKGKGIIMDELQEAFNKFNVHLAVIDEVFHHSGIEINDVDKLHTDPLAMNYSVTAFKLKGDEGAESVMLTGYKGTALGDIDIISPQIAIDNLSSYHWHNELQTAVEQARHQVELYMDGNFEMPEKEEKPTAKQMTIDEGFDNDQDFKEAAI
jgi:hypothetical protein